MCIARGGVDPAVTEETADDRQALAERKRPRGKTVTQIVDAHIVEPRTCPDAPPGMLQVCQMAALLASGDSPRVVVLPLDVAQHGDRGFA